MDPGHVRAQTMIEIRPDWNTAMDNKMEWWHNAKYGMFIHWGPDALPRENFDRGTATAEEWREHSSAFNPVDFDAKMWVEIVQNAGMKYIVYTTKHHNGFVMYDSGFTDYDIIDHTPFDRDPLKELADACFEAGIRLGVYYSDTDLYQPDFPQKYANRRHYNPDPNADLDKYVEYMQNQIRELLTNYGKIDIMWMDDGGAFRPEGGEPEGAMEWYLDEYPQLIHANEIMEMMRTIQPDIIINDRFGHGTIDFVTPEEFIPESGTIETFHNFEVCMTMNDTWMFNKANTDWFSGETALKNLVDIVSKGGNYLLNVGPTPEGVIPAQAVEILSYSGDWLKKYGESIFNTKGTQWGQPEWGRITHRILPDDTTRLYLHVFNWPENGKLVLDTVRRRPIQAYAMRSIPRENYSVAIVGNAHIEISLDGTPWDEVSSVVVLDVDKAR